MTSHQSYAFNQLLAAWRRRDDLRTADAPHAARAAARKDLDDARAHMSQSLYQSI